MADVNIVVRVRRTVVQDEPRATGRCDADGLVDLRLLPLLDPAGLALREVPAHRETRVRQVSVVL